VRKDTEKALMAYRQSLQDGLPVEQVQQRLDAAKASSPNPPACSAAMA
jgi:high-affinity iron transporter